MLHTKIDQMDLDQLRILNDLLRQIELEVLIERLNAGFDEAKANSRADQVARMVAEFRAKHPYR